MNQQLEQIYRDVSFTPELTRMFTDIIESEPNLKKVLVSIAKYNRENRDNEVHGGITVVILENLIVIDRKVKVKSGFQPTKTTINRKHAERLVDNLLKMSLCYKVSIGTTNLIYLTERGHEVLKELALRNQKNNS